MGILRILRPFFILSAFFITLSTFAQKDDDPVDLTKLLMEARNYYEAKDMELALELVDSAISVNPDNGDAYLIRGMIYESKGQPRRAINEYNNAIRFDPNNPITYYNRSLVRHEVGDHRNYSLNDINRAIELDPDNDHYYYQKSFYLTSTTYPLPEYNLAIEAISRAIDLDPDNASYFNLRARYKSESEQLLASLSDYTKAIELDNRNPEYFNDRGLIYLLIEDYLKAIEDFNGAIQIDPLQEEYLMNRGQARFNLTDYETAILDFTLSIETIYGKISKEPGKITIDHPLNRSLRRSYLYRGSALLQGENTFEACQDFEAAANLGDTRAIQYVKTYCQ